MAILLLPLLSIGSNDIKTYETSYLCKLSDSNDRHANYQSSPDYFSYDSQLNLENLESLDLIAAKNLSYKDISIVTFLISPKLRSPPNQF